MTSTAAVIATPASAAQSVVERMSRAGIRGVLNFAPRKVEVPRKVVMRTVNITIELEGSDVLDEAAGGTQRLAAAPAKRSEQRHRDNATERCEQSTRNSTLGTQRSEHHDIGSGKGCDVRVGRSKRNFIELEHRHP